MFLEPFLGPRLLVERCRSQTTVLQDYLREVGERLELTFTRTENALLQYRARLSEKIEPEKSLIFREALNSLAVCLDIALCDAARIAGKESLEKIRFPFAKKESDFKRAVKQIDLGPKFEEWLQRVHPGFGRNLWIAELHDLDVLTKHRIVVPLLAAPAVRLTPDAHPLANRGFAAIFGSLPVLLRDGALVSVDLKGRRDPVGFFQLTGEVRMLLPDDVPLGGFDAIEVLEKLANAMLEYIDSVEELSTQMRR